MPKFKSGIVSKEVCKHFKRENTRSKMCTFFIGDINNYMEITNCSKHCKNNKLKSMSKIIKIKNGKIA